MQALAQVNVDAGVMRRSMPHPIGVLARHPDSEDDFELNDVTGMQAVGKRTRAQKAKTRPRGHQYKEYKGAWLAPCPPAG